MLDVKLNEVINNYINIMHADSQNIFISTFLPIVADAVLALTKTASSLQFVLESNDYNSRAQCRIYYSLQSHLLSRLVYDSHYALLCVRPYAQHSLVLGQCRLSDVFD